MKGKGGAQRAKTAIKEMKDGHSQDDDVGRRTMFDRGQESNHRDESVAVCEPRAHTRAATETLFTS